MKFTFFLIALALLIATAISSSISSQTQIERGRYIVNEVAMCIQCHTPRDKSGELDRSQLLQGAPMPVESPFPDMPWAFRAPDLAGLPGWDEEEAIHLLETGARFDGRSPQPPMPPFRLSREDAAAVVAYLKSL